MHYTRKEQFGNYLKNMRERFQLTQDALAERIGVSKSYISKLEHAANDTMPSMKFLERLADIFGVHISEVQAMAGVWDEKKLDALVEARPDVALILIELSEWHLSEDESVTDILERILDNLSYEEPSEDLILPIA